MEKRRGQGGCGLGRGAHPDQELRPSARQLELQQVKFCLARLEVAGVLLAETNIPVAVDGVVEQACNSHDARSKFCHRSGCDGAFATGG